MAARGKSTPLAASKHGANYLCVQPNGEMELSFIDKSKLCADACSKKEFCEILTRRLSLRDLCVDSDGTISALTLFDTEIRSDVKLLALFKPEFNLGLRPNPWAKAVLTGILKSNDKLVIFGPVLVVIQHNIQYQQSLLELKQEGMCEILSKRGLPQPVQAAASAGISKRSHNTYGMNANGHDVPQLATDTDLDLNCNANAAGIKYHIPAPDRLIAAIHRAEAHLPSHHKCTSAEDEERYMLTSEKGDIQERPKVKPCTFFRLDEPCLNLKPPSRRTFSGQTHSCSYSHHPSTFQYVPRWCLDDSGFICWCLKYLPQERKVTQEILKRLLRLFEKSAECPICFHKQLLLSWHSDGSSPQQNHSACCSCMLQILEHESPAACPQCRIPLALSEHRSLKEHAEAMLPQYKVLYEVASELHSQLNPTFTDLPSFPLPGAATEPIAKRANKLTKQPLKSFLDPAELPGQCSDAWSNHSNSDETCSASIEPQEVFNSDQGDAKRGKVKKLTVEIARDESDIKEDVYDPAPCDPIVGQYECREVHGDFEHDHDKYGQKPVQQFGCKQGLETPGTASGSDLDGRLGFEISVASAGTSEDSVHEIGATPKDFNHEYHQEADIREGFTISPHIVDTADIDEIDKHGVHLPTLPSSPPPPPPPRTPPQASSYVMRSSASAVKRPPPPSGPPSVLAPGPTIFVEESSKQTKKNDVDVPMPAFTPPLFRTQNAWQPVAAQDQSKIEVQQWLHDHCLLQYAELLHDIGGDSLDFVQFLQMSDLDGLCIPILHKRALVAWASQIGHWRAKRANNDV